MNNNRKYTVFIDYALLYLLLGLSGIPVIYKQPLGNIATIAGVLLIAALLLIRKYRFNKLFFIVFSGFLAITAAHFIAYKEFSITYVNLALRLFLAYGVIRILGNTFIDRYCRMLYFFSVLSFILFVPCALIPGFEQMLAETIARPFDFYTGPELYRPFPSMGIYTFCADGYRALTGMPRNAGPFWEPGAFGGFLIIGIIFNLLRKRGFRDKQNVIFAIAILTTFSTTAYVAYFLLIMTFLGVVQKNRYALLGLPLLLGFALIAYGQFDFLGNKIAKQASIIDTKPTADLTRNRMVSALLDWKDIQEHPIIGRGVARDMRFDDSTAGTRENHRNNGTTDIMVRFGIPLYLIFMLGYFIAFRRMSDNFYPVLMYLSFVLIIALIGVSEMYFLKPLFLGFPFLMLIKAENTR